MVQKFTPIIIGISSKTLQQWNHSVPISMTMDCSLPLKFWPVSDRVLTFCTAESVHYHSISGLKVTNSWLSSRLLDTYDAGNKPSLKNEGFYFHQIWVHSACHSWSSILISTLNSLDFDRLDRLINQDLTNELYLVTYVLSSHTILHCINTLRSLRSLQKKVIEERVYKSANQSYRTRGKFFNNSNLSNQKQCAMYSYIPSRQKQVYNRRTVRTALSPTMTATGG